MGRKNFFLNLRVKFTLFRLFRKNAEPIIFIKEANAWFTLLQGRAEMIIEGIETKERIILQLDSEKPQTVYIPHHIAHALNNLSDVPYILVTYTKKLFDTSDTLLIL